MKIKKTKKEILIYKEEFDKKVLFLEEYSLRIIGEIRKDLGCFYLITPNEKRKITVNFNQKGEEP